MVEQHNHCQNCMKTLPLNQDVCFKCLEALTLNDNDFHVTYYEPIVEKELGISNK
jgi:predicted nucleic acid-binding Zn ribbon protein